MNIRKASAFAPASVGNVGIGFDMLGLALADVGDVVTVERVAAAGVQLAAITASNGVQLKNLSLDPAKNTAAIAANALWQAAGGTGGLALSLQKGIPLSSGMGGSAASAVAAVVAANALLQEPLSLEDLLPYALHGEEFASGSVHADNVAPSLLGGLVFCPPALLPRMVQVPTPKSISCILLHPELSINTAESRRGLARTYTLEQWIEQQSYGMGFMLACASDDHDLLKRSLHDVLIEPQRKGAVSCFDAVHSAALKAGAFGGSLSGSGPSIFMLAPEIAADAVASAMLAASVASGTGGQVWVSPLNARGAHLVTE